MAAHCDCWYWEAHENYQKGGQRNRCLIAGPNRVEQLSIPLVKGKHQSTPIRQVAINYSYDWVTQHRRTLQAAYGRSPFYEHYAPGLFTMLEQRPEKLWTLNTNIHQQLLAWLGLQDKFGMTTSWQSPVQTSELTNTLDLRPNNSEIPFEPLPYPQPFQDRHGFIGGLSILDLLFCLGPTASLHLRSKNESLG